MLVQLKSIAIILMLFTCCSHIACDTASKEDTPFVYEIRSTLSYFEVATGHTLQLSCSIWPRIPNTVVWTRMPISSDVNATEEESRFRYHGNVYFKQKAVPSDAGRYKCVLFARGKPPSRKLIREERVIDVKVETCDSVNSRACSNRNGKVANRACYVLFWKCDGVDDCGNGADEVDCLVRNPLMPICHVNETRCFNEGICIARSFECDGETDCRVVQVGQRYIAEDEANCGRPQILNQHESESGGRNYRFIKAGEMLNLNCTSTGRPKPFLFWRHNGKVLKKYTIVSQMVDELEVDSFKIIKTYRVTTTLRVYSTSFADAGLYTCEAISSAGRAFFDYEVTVNN